MKVRLLFTSPSNSLKRLSLALSQKLGYKVIRSKQPKPFRRNLQYGAIVNKLQQYQWFKEQGLSALEFTTSPFEADKWITEGHTVFGRHLLNASCGKGITVHGGEGDSVLFEADAAPVYTKYKKKKHEFRVHVFQDKVVAIVTKKRKKDWNGQQDTKIRNLANGYVFVQNFPLEDSFRKRIEALALAAAKVSKSDFRGVDLGYNEKNDDLFVIEVNSAPGIEGSNVDKYVQAIAG